MTDKFRIIIATVTDFSNYELLKNKSDEFQDKIAKGIVVVCGSSKGTLSEFLLP